MKPSVEDTRCVWMASNTVDYKLCDKNFDCEHCEFDKVMHNSARSAELNSLSDEAAEQADIIDRLLNGLVFEHHHEKSIYLPNNLVLDELADHTFRLSLSSFAGHFLDNAYAMVPCGQGEEVRKGHPCVTLSGAWGGITVYSPIHFLYLDKSYDSIQHAPLQWVVGIIQAEKNEIARESLSSQEWQQQIIDVSRKLIQYRMRRPDADQSANNSVIRSKYLYQRIGKEHYLCLLNFIFKQKIKSRCV